jgi:hypothetical protein
LDSDDIALESRFQKQFDFLEGNPDHGLVGSWMLSFGDRLVLRKFPVTDADIKVAFLFENPFGHPSVMFRRDWEKGQPGQFNKEFGQNCEDFEYWVRMSALWKCANLPEALTLYRIHQNQETKKSAEKRMRLVESILFAQHNPLGSKPLPPSANLSQEWAWWESFERIPAVRDKFEAVSLRRKRRQRLMARVRSLVLRALPPLAVAAARTVRAALRKFLSTKQAGFPQELHGK